MKDDFLAKAREESFFGRPEVRAIEEAALAYLGGSSVEKIRERYGKPAQEAFGRLAPLTSIVAADIFHGRFPPFPRFNRPVPGGGYREIMDLPVKDAVGALGYGAISEMDRFDAVSTAIIHHFWNTRDTGFLANSTTWKSTPTVFTRVIKSPPHRAHAFLGPLLSCLDRKEWLRFGGPAALLECSHQGPGAYSKSVLYEMVRFPVLFRYLLEGASVIQGSESDIEDRGELWTVSAPRGARYGRMSPILMLEDASGIDAMRRDELSCPEFHQHLHDYIFGAIKDGVEWTPREMKARICGPNGPDGGKYCFRDAVASSILDIPGWRSDWDEENPLLAFRVPDRISIFPFTGAPGIASFVRGLAGSRWFTSMLGDKVSPSDLSTKPGTFGDCFAVMAARVAAMVVHGRVETAPGGIAEIDDALVSALAVIPAISGYVEKLSARSGDDLPRLVSSAFPRFQERLSVSAAMSCDNSFQDDPPVI